MKALVRRIAVGLVWTLWALWCAVAAQGGAGNAGTLTPQDYIDIQQLVARYAYAIDNCTNNGYGYADLYVGDGWFAPSRDGKILTSTPGAISWRQRPLAARKTVRACRGTGSATCSSIT